MPIQKKNPDPLQSLPNVSTVLSDHLTAVGIDSPEKLKELGSREAFLRIRETRDPGACLSMLCALEGAIQGVRWFDLPEKDKQQLKRFHKDHK